MGENPIKEVKQYYDESAMREWERLETHPFEFELTTWMMDKYIKPGDTILDIGGGPGQYSMYYAKKGVDVTLVDLSSGNIELAKEKAKEQGVRIQAYVKNCLQLDQLNLGKFDHVFLMGPLYHLQQEKDRIQAVELALNHLKIGGKLYVSFILAFAGVIYDLQHRGYLVDDVNNKMVNRLFADISQGKDYLGPGFTQVYFYHQNNILPFMEQFPLNKFHLFGQEGFLAPNKLELIQRDPSELSRWVELAKQYIELPELLSWSEHVMYIGEKQ